MKQILFILSIITFLSCTKEEPEPTPPKPNEADTMRALINGEEWSAYCGSSIPGLGCTKVNCQYYPDTKSFELIAAGGESNYLIFVGRGSNWGGIKVGKNALHERGAHVQCSNDACLNENCRKYELDTTQYNFLDIISIDLNLKIIEGEFKFSAINYDCNDTIIVTDGYFRTNYRP